MKAHIDKLYQLSSAKSRRIIGLMSGTSMDGLDIAVCRVEGSGLSTKVKVEFFKTISYSDSLRFKVKEVFANPNAGLEQITLLNAWLARQHAEMILSALEDWSIKSEEIDLIASHGQTIYHAPLKQHGNEIYPNATLQIGDGDHLAVLTQIITLSDFRQKHVAAGGEGAPLAVYGDYFLFSEEHDNRFMLNIGGISNFTFLPGSLNSSEIFSTDVGPGNTLMDQYVAINFKGLCFDKDARIAKEGQLSKELLNALLADDFFTRDFPKSTGPEVFNLEYLTDAQKRSHTLDLKKEDVLCTLCHFTAKSITNAILKTIKEKELSDKQNLTVFASGGGIHNPLLMDLLKADLINFNFRNLESLGVPPDAKEAVLFAVLANESIAGVKQHFEINGEIPAVSMGKISLPG